MNTSKNEQLSALRREYWRQEILLSLQIRHAEIEDAYHTRAAMRELNQQISELIWNGAKLKQFVIPELCKAIEEAIWALHKSSVPFAWDVLDYTRMYVLFPASPAEQNRRKPRGVVISVPEPEDASQADLVLIDGVLTELPYWIKQREEEFAAHR